MLHGIQHALANVRLLQEQFFMHLFEVQFINLTQNYAS